MAFLVVMLPTFEEKQKSTGNRSRIPDLLGRVGLKSHETPVGQSLMAYFPGQTLNDI